MNRLPSYLLAAGISILGAPTKAEFVLTRDDTEIQGNIVYTLSGYVLRSCEGKDYFLEDMEFVTFRSDTLCDASDESESKRVQDLTILSVEYSGSGGFFDRPLSFDMPTDCPRTSSGEPSMNNDYEEMYADYASYKNFDWADGFSDNSSRLIVRMTPLNATIDSQLFHPGVNSEIVASLPSIKDVWEYDANNCDNSGGGTGTPSQNLGAENLLRLVGNQVDLEGPDNFGYSSTLYSPITEEVKRVYGLEDDDLAKMFATELVLREGFFQYVEERQ